MYYFAGALSMFWGILVLFIMPPDPVRARGFNERERYIMVSRVRTNNSGVRNTHLKVEQILELFLDVKFWLMFSIAFLCMIANGKTSPELQLSGKSSVDNHFRRDFDVHTDHHTWIRLQYAELSPPSDASGLLRWHGAATPAISSIQIQEQPILPRISR